jgi:hypothetical protein
MQTAYVVNKGKGTVLDVCGPTVEFLNSTDEKDAAYCIMIGTIPPGVSVPLHSHPDVESFFTLSGTVQVLFQRGDQLEWIDVKQVTSSRYPRARSTHFETHQPNRWCN